MKTETTRSAGGVVLDDQGNVLLIRVQRRGEDRWSLPKGGVEPGETPEQAALREVREETGIHAEIVAPLPTIDYWFVAGPGQAPGDGIRYHKYVHFFLMRAIGGDVREHDAEVEEARWFPPRDAARACAYRSERALVEQAVRETG